MTVYHGEENWQVKITHITSRSVEKRIMGARMTVVGKAQVFDNEGDLLVALDFNYTGSPGENPERLHNYIKGLAISHRHNQRQKQQENTLQNYIEGLVER